MSSSFLSIHYIFSIIVVIFWYSSRNDFLNINILSLSASPFSPYFVIDIDVVDGLLCLESLHRSHIDDKNAWQYQSPMSRHWEQPKRTVCLQLQILIACLSFTTTTTTTGTAAVIPFLQSLTLWSGQQEEYLSSMKHFHSTVRCLNNSGSVLLDL